MIINWSEINLRLCTPFTNRKINLFPLQKEKDDLLAAGVRLPEESKWWGRTARSDWRGEGGGKAAVCWHLVTASHYCTDAMKYELDWLRVPIQLHRTPCCIIFKVAVACGEAEWVLLFLVVFKGLQGWGGTDGFNWDTGLCLQIREQQGGQSSGPPVSSQERSSSALVISNTIYISKPFLMQATC